MREKKLQFLLTITMLLLFIVRRSLALGRNNTGDTNFEVLLGDIELGQRPELYHVAATYNVQVNVTSDKQTIVATEGVNVRLDWSNWVGEELTNSGGNATYSIHRTHINDTGHAIGLPEAITESDPPERVAVKLDEENNEFYVEIACVEENDTRSDSAVYKLVACASENDECVHSNITLYVIKKPPPLEYECFMGLVPGRVRFSCRSSNRLVSRTCAFDSTGQNIPPCNDVNATITLSVGEYPPGYHNITINIRDIYGQTANKSITGVYLIPQPPSVMCHLSQEELNVYCEELPGNLDLDIVYQCSYDSGTTEPCGRNFIIDKTRFELGPHALHITANYENFSSAQRPTAVLGFFIRRETKHVHATPFIESHTELVIDCRGVDGDIGAVSCVYNDDMGTREVISTCALPWTVDLSKFDRNPGEYNFTIVANSTLGEHAEYTHLLNLSAIECVQLTEPGTTTLVCTTRIDPVRQLSCGFDDPFRLVPCENISNIVLSLSAYPVYERGDFSISVTDNAREQYKVTYQVSISIETLIQCSNTSNCSPDGIWMSARECCVDSEEGLSYTIPGSTECHECIVFGWLQDSYTGRERELAHTVKAGYLKGAQVASVNISMNVVVQSTGPGSSDFSLESDRITLRISDDPEAAMIEFLTDGLPNEGNESFHLWLVPTPSTIVTMPSGEGVFFVNTLELAIIDADAAPGMINWALIGSVIGVIGFLLIILAISLVVIVVVYRLYFHPDSPRKKSMQLKKLAPIQSNPHLLASPTDPAEVETNDFTVQTSLKLDLPLHLIIPSANIKLNETIGQGEYGIVYKGYIINRDGESFDEFLAIKTLKGFYDHSMVRSMLQECSRMSKFSHTNVLTLKGVCLDGGPAPFIIMPFMANGSLLSYLRKNRSTLTVAAGSDIEDVEIVRKQLLDMCIQIAKGMEYLASMKVVHRDLAARNCMIDCNFVIKVADFGLSESMGTKEYFRQDQESPVKVPIKWLPPESITDYLFSEKSDVWAYGVTCWEIFSGGRVPYSDLAVRDILSELTEGYRLEKPENEACDNDMYATIQQCWSIEPEKRPHFSELVSSLSGFLEGMAGYVHIGAFGVKEGAQDQT